MSMTEAQIEAGIGAVHGAIDAKGVVAVYEAVIASAPQEPDDALHFVTTISQMAIAGRSPQEIAKALCIAQEPVADGDAEWLLSLARRLQQWPDRSKFEQGEWSVRLERIANRLQAKAPETDHCGWVETEQAPETGEK